MTAKPHMTGLMLLLASLACAQQPTFPDTAQRSQRLFPLMHKMVDKAEAMGVEFPEPYGIAGSIYYQTQRMEISTISVGTLQLTDASSVVDIKGSAIENTTLTTQGRADLWLLPFLNVYGMAGRVTTFNDIRLKFNLTVPPIPGITQGDYKSLERNELAKVTGTVLGWGTVVAGGFGKVFANVNLTWANTYLNEVNSSQRAFVAVPMVGLRTDFANVFVGGMYQNTGQTNTGSFIGEGGTETQYTIEYKAVRWNYQVGLNKSIGHWQLNLIQGFGPRVNGVIEVGYRFGGPKPRA
jgi:hypothetical protein